MTKRLVLVDANGFIWRAHFGMPPRETSEGLQVGALYGFWTMVLKPVLENARADAVGIVFDHSRASFRHEILPTYKANRPEPPAELTRQMPFMREAAKACSLPVLEMQGYEADDIIASYATLARGAGWETTIVSSDKDLMQMVGPGIRLYDKQKKQQITEVEVREKFGVVPERVPCVQGLAGDFGDGIPGVPKIGVKIGAELVNRFGSLEALLENTDKIKQPGRRMKLEEHREMALISKQLATLKRDVPLEVPLEGLDRREYDSAAIEAFLGEHELKLAGPWSKAA